MSARGLLCAATTLAVYSAFVLGGIEEAWEKGIWSSLATRPGLWLVVLPIAGWAVWAFPLRRRSRLVAQVKTFLLIAAVILGFSTVRRLHAGTFTLEDLLGAAVVVMATGAVIWAAYAGTRVLLGGPRYRGRT
jgi:hypothetical protein